MSRAKGRRKPRDPELPPHANAKVHARIMRKLARMTPEEIFQTSVDAGIYTKAGKLTKHYAPRPSDSR
jgi:hypothetical protein